MKPECSTHLFEGLTAYAIERQNGMETYQAAQPLPSPELRKDWIRDILYTAAELDGVQNPAKLVHLFNERLAQAHGYAAVTPASKDLQRDTVNALCRYTSALANDGTDQRLRLMDVNDLLKDIEAWRPWDAGAIGIYPARGQAESSLRRLTAERPIRFTRLLLGPEHGPCENVFLSGSVTRADAVRKTDVFRKLAVKHPDIRAWTALCVVYGGHDGQGLHNASELDMTVIRQAGKDFLNEPGLCHLTGLIQLEVPSKAGKHKNIPKKRTQMEAR